MLMSVVQIHLSPPDLPQGEKSPLPHRSGLFALTSPRESTRFILSLWIHTMNRCNAFFSHTPARRLLLRAALAAPWLGMPALVSQRAWAQLNVRAFPPNAERGLMVVTYPPLIQMNGQPDRLSPGSRIRGLNTLLILSGSIIGQSLVVNFVRNPTGEVHDVWLLTDAEAALKLPTQP